MDDEEFTVLRPGQFLSLGTLVSANEAFALEHRHTGGLVLRDRTRAENVWTIGGGVGGPGRLELTPEGYLWLVDGNGRPLWRSGDVDRRVDAAVVTNDGRLVLTDPDGFQRWSRDLLSDVALAGFETASGDRLTRGQRLTLPLVSPNGRYELAHRTTEAETVLFRDQTAQLWSRKAGVPGEELTLGYDGILRTGTDSTVLSRWTGLRLDPTAHTVSALVVDDDGDVVLMAEDGSAVYRSGSAAEAARLDELQREWTRRERADLAKPVRPHGSGLPADWFNLVYADDEDSPPYSITLVRGISAGEAISRLEVEDDRVAPMTLAELGEVSTGEQQRIFTAQIDDWVMVVDLDAMVGADQLVPMSRGTQAVVCGRDHDGESYLGWAVDGIPSAIYWDDEALERGEPAAEGEQPDAVVPFMRTIGLGRYRDTDDDRHFLPPPVEIACLIAGVRPRPEHFAGKHLSSISSW